MRLLSATVSSLAVVALSLAGLLITRAAHAQESIVGLNTNNQLFRFSSTAPGTFTSLGGAASTLTTVTGLVAGDSLRSIDFRPSNGLLYGLASQVSGNTSLLRVYTVANDGAATLLTTLTPGAGTNGTTPTPAQAFSISDLWRIDFNPQADALRIVDGGDTDSGFGTGNYRVTAANLATANGVAASDAPINGRNAADRFVQGIAYSNNVAGASSTALYDAVFSNDTSDTIYLQSPANSGTLVLPNGTVRGNTGNFLTNNGAQGDMDISGITSFAYFGSERGFYTVNLDSGAASLVGGFSTGVGTVRGIAAPVNAVVVPEANTFALALPALAIVGTAVTKRRKK